MDLGFHADEMPPLTLIAWLRIRRGVSRQNRCPTRPSPLLVSCYVHSRFLTPDPGSVLGSDLLLMNLRRRCGLVSRGNQGHAVFSRLRVAPHGVLRGRCVEPRRQRRPYNPSDEREQCVPIMWRGFGPGPQSISSPLGGLTDRRAARRADAPGATLPLRGGSVRAAHLHRTLRRQTSSSLGRVARLDSIRSSIV